MLNGEEIEARQVVSPGQPLAPDQVQPNGIDLTLAEAWRWAEPGVLGRMEGDRTFPPRLDVLADDDGWVTFGPGAYGFRYGEDVAFPGDLGGLVFPRSSLLRMGVHVPTAVWDAGYQGRAEGLLVVMNPAGARLQVGARIAQLVLFKLTAPAQPYAGRFQFENLRRGDEPGG